MEAHNGLSARIVEEAGFRGIWASGLSISAALGVRDNNEASWTQVLEVVEFMSDATRIPILLDADTGYGNFNNMRRLVRKLEQRGVAAVCIEDKLFPKTNSFINSERQPLADLEEFTGKIKAVKEAQSDPDFCLVARLEGFIAGWGLDEVMRRAEACHAAGADALLVHSKKTDAGPGAGFRGRVERTMSAGDRADDLLQHAGGSVRAGRDQPRHLGEPQCPQLDRGDAGDEPADFRGAFGSECGRCDRAGEGSVPVAKRR